MNALRWLKRAHVLPLVRYEGDRWWVALNLQFEPGDLWVGVFWRLGKVHHSALHVYLCLVPTVPLHLTLRRHGGWFE